MRVFVLPGVVKPWDGVERHIFEVSKRLGGNGIEVHGVFFGKRRENMRVSSNYVVHIYPTLLSDKGLPLLLSRVVFFINLTCATLSFLLKDHRFDIIHAHGAYSMATNLARMIIPGVSKCRYIVTLHGVMSLAERELQQLEHRKFSKRVTAAFYRMLGLLVYRFAERYIAFNNRVAWQASSEYFIPATKIVIVPHGVCVQNFQEILPKEIVTFKENFSIPDYDLFVLYYGQIIPGKNLDRLVEAFSLVHDKYPDTKLMIRGWGLKKLERNIKQLIKDLGLSQSTIWIGPLRERGVATMLKLASIYVNPAIIEVGPSTTLLEAMAAGKAIVSSKIGGNAAVISHMWNGMAVNPEPRELASVIMTLLAEPELKERLGANAQEYARRYLDWDNAVVPRIMELYTSNKVK